MEIEELSFGPALVLKPLKKTLKGESVAEFKEHLLHTLPIEQSIIILDLSNIEILDSSSLSTIILFGLKATANNLKKFALCGLKDSLQVIFQVTNINNIFPLFPNKEEALKSLYGGASITEIVYVGNQISVYEDLKKTIPSHVILQKANSIDEFIQTEFQGLGFLILIESDYLLPSTEELIHKKKHFEKAFIIGLFPTDKSEDKRKKIQEYKINLALPIPLPQDELRTLISELTSPHSNEKRQTTRLPKKLYESYLKTIPEKIELLEQLIEKIQLKLTKNDVVQLRDVSHKMAGSAGTYGFVKAGEKCKALTLLLDEAINNDFLQEKDFVDHMTQLVSQIRLNFEVVYSVEQPENKISVAQIRKKTVLVISEDPHLTSLFKRASDCISIQIEVIDSLEKVVSSINSLSYRPELIVIDQSFNGDSEAGLKLLQKIKELIAIHQVHFWMFFHRDEVIDRDKALEEGVDLIINKPISLDNLIRDLSKIFCKETISSYKVLIVDDDKDLCIYLQSVLSEIGVLVEILNDGLKLLEVLERFQPNLLLLDIHLPEYDGWTLLKILRRDSRFESLPTIIITNAEEEKKSKKITDSFEEVWVKPFNNKDVKQKILKYAEANSTFGEFDAHLLSSFKPRKEFEEILTTIWNMNHNFNQPSYFVIIKSLEYNSISKPSYKKNFLIESENLINELLKIDSIKGYLRNGLFGFYTATPDKERLKQSLEHFVKESEYLIPIQGDKGDFATFSALLINCNLHACQPRDLVDFAINYFEKNTLLGSEVREV